MILEYRTTVHERLYPEILIEVEKGAHAEIDAVYSSAYFTERGQEWRTDPAFPQIQTLRAWGIPRFPAKVGYQTTEGHTSVAYLDTDGEGPGVHHGEDKYTDEPVSVIWDDTYGKWLQVPQ
jgi:hypothetical protein